MRATTHAACAPLIGGGVGDGVGDTVGVGVGVAGLEDVDGATLGAELGAELGETPPLIGATGAPVLPLQAANPALAAQNASATPRWKLSKRKPMLSPFFDKVRNCKGRVDATRG